VRSDIRPGAVFPDYALPDHTGTVRTLRELQGSDPLVLTLARGHYCPKEHQQHLEIAAAQYTDPENDPMIPHTLVLEPGLVVHTIYNGYWFWGRPSVVDLWHDLRSVTRRVRPDWDLSTPGLRERWDAGDLSDFHGWDTRARAGRPADDRG
jgi:hypothetical protein